MVFSAGWSYTWTQIHSSPYLRTKKRRMGKGGAKMDKHNGGHRKVLHRMPGKAVVVVF